MPSTTLLTNHTSTLGEKFEFNNNESSSSTSNIFESSSMSSSTDNAVIINNIAIMNSSLTNANAASLEQTISIEKQDSSSNDDASNPIFPLANNELDILIKMERANKEMENNHRSAQSILLSQTSSSNGTATNNNNSPPSHSLSRRASFTSCEVNSLNEEATSKMEEISWDLWNQIINDWTTWSKKKPSQLKEYIRKGIPLYLRPLAWQYLCGANLTDAKEKFKEYIKKQSSCEKIIRRDIDRTYPDQEFFRNAVGQESLFNVMKAYSIHDPEVGYCQGSAFICGLLLIQNIPEEESFSIFVQIMQHYNLREIYKPNMYYLGLCMYQLDNLLKEYLPDLHQHFAAHAFHTSMYSSSWFLTLYTTSLPLPLVCRIFDIFLNEGFEIIFRIGLALLEFHKEYLMMLDMEGMLKYFQKELPVKHENDHESILNRAFAIKYNQRKMKKLEKDFSVIKKEEQEEQVEMRRLRAENKLLKQRIDNLEKALVSLTDESANLAERLIKGQVINAQNAELIYILKNENQKLKDKLDEIHQENVNSVELREKHMNEQKNNSSEKELLHEKVEMLLKENSKLRETPDTQRLEEELVQVKMREAEAQLAIKELQKTIHVLNLEYQEFLNNRTAAILSMPTSQPAPSNGINFTAALTNSNSSSVEVQKLEEELLKVKMREAETQSEMKSINLKLMQFETEKQVAYNQIKRQDEEIRKLNLHIGDMQEKDVDTNKHLFEYRRQLDDKEAQLKESNMTHKLQEAEDAHIIAELRQRVASLEVQIQELVTTGQLNDNEKHLYNFIGSTDKLIDMNDDMKYMLMSSNWSLASDKHTLNKQTKQNPNQTPVNRFVLPGENNTVNDITTSMISLADDSTKLNFDQDTLNKQEHKNALKRSLSEKTGELTQQQQSIKNNAFNFLKNLNGNSQNGKQDAADVSKTSSKQNVIMEYLDSDNEEDILDDENEQTFKSNGEENQQTSVNQASVDEDIEELRPATNESLIDGDLLRTSNQNEEK